MTPTPRSAAPAPSTPQQPLLASARPSHTALLCGIARARHQLIEGGEIFADPLALDILGPAGAAQVRQALEGDGPQGLARDAGSFSQAMRGALAVRSRIAEDTLREAVAAGATQYVVLGAGLDTFALRGEWPRGLARVFEVDHPSTQAWKRGLAASAGLCMPPGAAYVPVDFERQDFMEQLAAQGLDAGQRTVFSWLGVTMYLAPSAVQATLARIGAGAAPGSVLVFDYVRRPGALQWGRKLALGLMARRFGRMGEPWRCFLRDAELRALLAGHGFEPAEFITPAMIRSTLLAHRPSTRRQRVLGGLLGGVVRVRVGARAPAAAR
ncbi:SAM-dependent methyltransferase [Acidovorax sp. sif1233]|uniref:class I SAM-dependent methyltransferase n=1 Tax=Acidovorax sp. sif1233 TaxID=2854792 RepID=UPI001C45648F|nr:SAM-dependent methyltransferase [Acidovorax sp. sif1233]MBV7454877.1 SAM-dependent methyltransferase [Acidovorax sp. sif1233]